MGGQWCDLIGKEGELEMEGKPRRETLHNNNLFRWIINLEIG
jgi:hypothetical protein